MYERQPNYNIHLLLLLFISPPDIGGRTFKTGLLKLPKNFEHLINDNNIN